RRLQYIEGDPRFRRIRGNTTRLVELWARKEFKNLQTAQKAGIRVPSPLVVKRNVLIMEFIGSDGKPYPLLSERAFEKDYRKVLNLAKRLYRQAGLVHADLSEYNIFKGKTELVLFDLASAVDISHPQAQNFLIRDLNNVNRFFMKQKVSVEGIDRIFKRTTGNEIQADSKSSF
ncbi:MAG: RIO1 family regulatory kinase/ATPase, partial [Nitrososphaerales archaeon]